ncbi:type II toxin-antitoxin system VapC family toxin [Synechococcus sp. 1G10]|uniref:type II toxin-antitoxin system VapC family toxin n=1 Tax=Synechococcus sp. 1G10 TaxID=2025605 RepID=UPI000B986661|nr:type II toxin-antitoxin system VapC family toxin [Synechococcus sp. 1G10]
MFLLDTVVISELRRHERDPGVVAWLSELNSDDLYLSVISLGEIERGIVIKQNVDAVFARRLQGWLEGLLLLYGQRILPVDGSIARRWGQLSARIGHHGADLMIAATALEHNLQVVTRNVRHFIPTGVEVLNPFTGPGSPHRA